MNPRNLSDCTNSRNSATRTRPAHTGAGLVLASLLAATPLFAESDKEARTGPRIADHGAVYAVPDSFNLRTDTDYRIVMDVTEGGKSHDQPNEAIDSAARFLNMHARSGIPNDHLELALVLHGEAAPAALSNDAYRERFGTANPNDALFSALTDADVTIYLCGQSAGSRGYAREEWHPAITPALSAMTVLVRLQQEGWALLP